MSNLLLPPDEFYDSSSSVRSSYEFRESFDIDDADYAAESELLGYGNKPYFLLYRERDPLVSRFISSVPLRLRYLSLRRVGYYLHVLLGFVAALIVFTFLFRPSYSRPPPHYRTLQHAIQQSQAPGRGNPHNEKVFIAINLYDKGGSLARGKWGQAVLELIDLLGEDNTYLSIYENDSGYEAEHALWEFDKQVKCNSSVVFERHYDFTDTPEVTLGDGSVRKRRIPYLAELRNKVLQPLDGELDMKFDRVLYLNDVYFNPIDAVQLLFSTNTGLDGRPHYRAACAVDFGNLLKFYDSFAVRDSHGYPIGVPFFPWFTSAGHATSRRDVLDEKDAVRVRSCWGGITAFDAKYLQQPKKTITEDETRLPFLHSGLADRRIYTSPEWRKAKNNGKPLRFRAISDMYWEASESCLIHADIQEPYSNIDDIIDTGVYMNPYIRVSYDYTAFTWLGFVRRFERLFTIPNWIANTVSGHPAHNSRRTDIAGKTVEQRVWKANTSHTDGGYWTSQKRIAPPGSFCARRDLFVLISDRKEGEDGWEPINVPRDPDSKDWIQP
ncbi:cryptococcal mannosyltransferase 1-domain-containing protein [Talaromyces proteolyticus]|uniref:Cryptococcal mannosyltransferase 1-domain-containing protein n=1 Tax=Talaromyces proteolyticus TaxID=1131652 RepID=A0AAD4PZN9_9EURO|nr:cryptococcal mannosyltransferase 1-domain-containing protein [Talaromyces proteolyticus]KAH8696083.1 cryptococcal mannosyltransferase 1-domain-containing protein [Talaromyces proteolyticus]